MGGTSEEVGGARRWFSILAAATLVLAACQGGGDGEGDGEEGGPIKIGLSGALTGGDAFLGQSQREGALLALQEINDAGGVNGRQLEFVIEDESNDPSRTAEIAQKLISRDEVAAIIGGTNDGTAQVIAQAAAQAQVPFIVPFANGDQISQGNDWTFQVDVASTVFVDKLSECAVNGFDRVGIIYDDNAFGQADRDFALEDLEGFGEEAAAVVAIPDVGRDYSPQLRQFIDVDAEVMIAPVSGTNAAQLRKDMTRLDYDALLMGPNSLAFESMIDVGGEFVEHEPVLLDVIDEDKPEVQEFQEKFEAQYGRPANTGFELLGYDAINILAFAMEEAGSTDPEAVRNELENLTDYEAVSGRAGSTISYSPDDHRRASPEDLVWRWVDNAEFANAPVDDQNCPDV
jgi:branched-chain amino acid transport system substrate-binding protein